MLKRPRILITNDDGISAPGIHHLWETLQPFADLFIVAPSCQQSGVGLSASWRSTLEIKEIQWETCPAWSVSGTPADCVKLALSILLPSPPDLIVSGINSGSNAGKNVLYSGTVASVIEGVFQGIPGIAFSSYDMNKTEYDIFKPFISPIVEYVIAHPLPQGTILNVNFPSISCLQERQIPGIKLTRQGKGYWMEKPEKVSLESSAMLYKLGEKLVECQEHEESDIHWLKQGFITCVPIHVEELTDSRFVTAKKEHFEQFLAKRRC